MSAPAGRAWAYRLAVVLVAAGLVAGFYLSGLHERFSWAWLRANLTAQRRLADREGRLALRAPSEPVRRLLDITGLTDHFVVES